MKAILRRTASMVVGGGGGGISVNHNPISSTLRISNLVEQLRHYKPPESSSSSHDDRGKAKRAAVLVCLFEGELGDLRVILTKRSSKLSTHSGEVSLPGGKMEEGDADERETAIRESREEIGLDPSLVTVVTVLEPFVSKYLFRVVPVIAMLSNRQAFKPTLNAEVEAVFDAPLEMFLKDENRRSEEREWKGVKFTIHHFDHVIGNERFMIWGLTSSILIHAASVVYQRAPSFPVQERFKMPTLSTRKNGSSL